MRTRAKLTLFAYQSAARVAQSLPEAWLPVVGKCVGVAGGWPQREHRRMAARHQRRVSGRTDRRVVDEVFAFYGRYWLEIFRIPADVRRGVIAPNWSVDGVDYISKALDEGHGAILALPHLGGWEWAAAWMAEEGHRMLAVVEALEPPEVLEWFELQREAMGLEVVALGPDVSTKVLRALRDNRVVCLLADRDLTGDGVDVEFFGEPTTLPGGPATLALRTGAAILPVAVYFTPGRGHHAVVRPPLPIDRTGRLRDDIARITRLLAAEFEELIRVHPEQWHLLQPNWPSDRQ